jgi:hypothetical protein
MIDNANCSHTEVSQYRSWSQRVRAAVVKYVNYACSRF